MSATRPFAPVRSHRAGAKLTSLLAILASIVAVPAFASADTGQAQPPLAAAEPTADLGTLVKGDTVSHDFVLLNRTDEPVRIERVASSCTCAVAEFDETVPPDGEGLVRTELDTMNLTGKGSSSIEVYVEGAEAPAVTFVLTYVVESKLLADPGYARWNVVRHEEEGTIAQTVYSADGATFEIVEVEAPIPSIAVEYREANPEERQEGVNGSQWIVEATLDSEAPTGPLTGDLTVHTTHPRQKTAWIPVSGFVRPAVFIEPPRGDFGRVEPEVRSERVFRVRMFSSEPILLTGAATDVEGVSARVVAVDEGRDYRVVLEFDPEKMGDGPFAGTLRVDTDSEVVPSVTADFTGELVHPTGEAPNETR